MAKFCAPSKRGARHSESSCADRKSQVRSHAKVRWAQLAGEHGTFDLAVPTGSDCISRLQVLTALFAATCRKLIECQIEPNGPLRTSLKRIQINSFEVGLVTNDSSRRSHRIGEQAFEKLKLNHAMLRPTKTNLANVVPNWECTNKRLELQGYRRRVSPRRAITGDAYCGYRSLCKASKSLAPNW